MFTAPERGIAITTPEIATEGADAVLDAIARTGATAITTTTSVVVPSDEPTPLREPPHDTADTPCALDRPIWGRTSTWVNRYVAHPPDPALWRDLPWPEPPLAPPDHRVDHARAAIDAARARGLRVYIHLAPYYLPSGPAHRDDMPTNDDLRIAYRPQRLISGIHPAGVSWIGCVNNPTIRAYGRARLIELLRHYGDVDGIALDGIEYSPIYLEKLFTCFCDHCQAAATAQGYDWDAITAAVRVLWDSLHTLTGAQLDSLIQSGDWGDLVPDPDQMLQGFTAWFDFKQASVEHAIADLRDTMRLHGAGAMAVANNGYAPPWRRMSGARVPRTDLVETQRLELFSADWLMMTGSWAASLLAWNRGAELTLDQVVRGWLSLFGLELERDPGPLTPEMFTLPAPNTRHNLTPESYTYRLDSTLLRRDGQSRIVPTVHAYRPASEFAELLDHLQPFAGNGLWIHRYGYLSDEKLDILRTAWARA